MNAFHSNKYVKGVFVFTRPANTVVNPARDESMLNSTGYFFPFQLF